MIGVGSPPAAERNGPRSMRATERECWIALSQVPGLGPVGFAQLVARHGSAASAWTAGAVAVNEVVRGADTRTGVVDAMRRDPRHVARGIERATARAGGRVVTALDEAFPPALRTLDPRPPTLFCIGSESVFLERSVAIVGTRRASGYGLAVATELADELARAGIVVVSGLALGIDGAAHRAAVAAAGRTVAVLPSPIDRVYPPRHRGLARDIVRGGGALVSEIAVGAQVGKPDFARRNRIIAGLAEAVVVVEAPDRSGALLTVAAARQIGNREVYAVPGPIDALASRGCNRLIADRDATILTSAVALLQQVGRPRRAVPPAIERLSEVEGQLLRHLLERSGSIEELVDRTRQAPASVASALTLLEARGLADAFGGATFHATPVARRLADGLATRAAAV